MINTFDALELDALNALSTMFPPICHLLENHVHNECLDPFNSSSWKVDFSCLNWLDTKAPGLVVYVKVIW